jgi:putative Holliday junction resolvase
VEQLRAHVQCPVHVLDERLTTVEGERALLATDTSRRKRKQLIDQVAAQLILQAYLDAHAPRS